MIPPLLLSALLAFSSTLALELSSINLGPRRANSRFPGQTPSLALGLLATSFVMAALSGGYYGNTLREGALPLVLVALGGLVLFGAGFISDRGHASSSRHLFATLVAAVLTFSGGIAARVIGLPGMGTMELVPVASLIFTVLWLFLVVSAVEIFSLLPLAAGIIALLVGSTALMPFLSTFKTYAGAAMCGALLGAVPARTLGELLRVRGHNLEKSEVLVLGHLVGCATLAIFLKSVAGAVVIPLSLFAIVFVILATHSLDRSLILRAKPKE